MRILLSVSAALFFAFFAGSAFATECPAIWQQINEKMKAAHLSAPDQAKLAELRKQSEDFHHAGDHGKSVAALKQALTLFD